MNTLDTACGIDVKYVVLQVLVITRRSFEGLF
jgi:hypothetical protein